METSGLSAVQRTMKDVLKSALMTNGGLCVMIAGATLMHKLCAINSATCHKVTQHLMQNLLIKINVCMHIASMKKIILVK